MILPRHGGHINKAEVLYRSCFLVKKENDACCFISSVFFLTVTTVTCLTLEVGVQTVAALFLMREIERTLGIYGSDTYRLRCKASNIDIEIRDLELTRPFSMCERKRIVTITQHTPCFQCDSLDKGFRQFS